MRAIRLADEKGITLPDDQRAMLQAVASGDRRGLPVRIVFSIRSDPLELTFRLRPDTPQEKVHNELRKTQLLLYPATSHLNARAEKPSDARFSELLPLGIPKTTHEYVSPVPIVKPSTRFSMLSIV